MTYRSTIVRALATAEKKLKDNPNGRVMVRASTVRDLALSWLERQTESKTDTITVDEYERLRLEALKQTVGGDGDA